MAVGACQGSGYREFGRDELKASDFLSIDVDSELRTLCAEQVQGSWQLATELIRFAIRHGATAVEVTHSKNGFRVRSPGTLCSSDHLQRVVVALDSAQGDEDRHRAIVALEEDGVQCLLWLTGAEGSTVRIVTRPKQSATVLESRPDHPPSLETDAAVDVDDGFDVVFNSPRFDVEKSRTWIATSCRFAPVTVTVDQAEVTQGFQDPLFTVSVGRPLPGAIAITARGDAPHLWLLRHGVLAARATVPGYPPFEAAVELGGLTQEGATPDELRETVNPHLPTVVDQAVELLVDAVGEGPFVDSERVSRLATLCLRTAHKGLQSDRIALKVISSVDLESGARTNLALADLRRMSDDEGQYLWSVPPETDMSRLPADGRILLVLTPEQHGLLTELVSGPVQRPEPRQSSGWSRLIAGVHEAWNTVRRRLTPESAGRLLKDNELLAAERFLLDQLEEVTGFSDGEPLHAQLCAGVGRVRRQGRSLLLPRNNPLVVQAVRLMESDEEWRYPALLAVVGDEASISPEVRVRWRRRVLTPRP